MKQGHASRRILIVRLGAIGDVTNALVVANAIRDAWPEAQIAWAVHPLSAPLVEGHPSVDRVHVWPRGGGLRGFRRLVKEVRQERYGIALDLQRLQKSALLARLSGARRVLGFDRPRSKELSWLWTGERIETGPRREHMVRQYARFSRLLGLPEAPPRRDLPRRPEAVRFAEEWTGARGRPLLLNLGASKPEKTWPASSFRELAEILLADGFPGPIALTGGPSDREAASHVSEGLDVVDLVGQTTLPELWELCRSARGMVTADTGPMHLCAAVGTPVVSLFGPGDPARTGPFGAGHRVLVQGRTLATEDGSISHGEPWLKSTMESTSPEHVARALCAQGGMA